MESKAARISELNAKALSEDFWNDNETAQQILKERSEVESIVSGFEALESDFFEFEELLELAEAEEDDDASLTDELVQQLEDFDEQIAAMETKRLLSDPLDQYSAFVQFSAGAGGVDSNDWTAMLFRMVSRYAEKKGFQVKIVDYQENEEGGIKGATINVVGDYAYGYLRSERGIHRLVRISPYDAAARRHTSFAAVNVVPEIDDTINIDIKEEDLRIDTYRAGGHGGQHVNKTDSAVRITHIPSGIVVQCQNERSQFKNRAQAMKVLKSRLYKRELEERRKEQQERDADKKEISWGSQIRSYVMAPYQLVKDVRTGVEKGNVSAVLDGDLDPFVRAYLLAQSED